MGEEGVVVIDSDAIQGRLCSSLLYKFKEGVVGGEGGEDFFEGMVEEGSLGLVVDMCDMFFPLFLLEFEVGLELFRLCEGGVE